jgi:hypothetical protein
MNLDFESFKKYKRRELFAFCTTVTCTERFYLTGPNGRNFFDDFEIVDVICHSSVSGCSNLRIQIVVSCVVTTCSHVDAEFYSEDGGGMLIRDVGNHLQYFTASP